ncbi:MAG: phytanoyl-CoA dioxygenase family protein [Planctomycetes bacterium]|nr:phytanoyl-CoA dioxygenase family protein [Planctomycetota bacterium]MCH9725851.1 phytanoyl-CoA dioxygenase family protein [Planctomycetota bacterium]MCH9775415.1 phytanoyl-CoA dioxygenase family protein [Planctomycetota bacterium]MCH9793080.1 phytanoyl-CoA dioxygenase family protein [Planctomycetota bacterium]
MSFESEKQSYDQNGFAVIRQFLGETELADLTGNLDRYISDVVPQLPDADAFYVDRNRPETLKQMQHMGGDVFFRDYSQHSKWCELAEALVGEPANCEQPEWFNKPPNTNHVTPPHQDNYYFCLVPSNVVTIWLALDEVDAENGCLRYVKESHKHGYRKHAKSKILGFSQGITDYSPDDFSNEAVMCLQPGDAIAHHGMTIHRADANMSTTRHRRSFAMVFKGVSCQRDEAAYERYLNMASEQQQAQGLNV